MRARREPQEAGAGTKFRLLMWKNFLQQWRHPGQTAAELLLPVITMALVLILRSQIEPVHMDTITYPSIPAHTLNYSSLVLGGMNLTRLSIAYSPENPILENVMQRAVSNLIVDNIVDLLPVILEILPELSEIELPDIPGFPDWPNWPDWPDLPELPDLPDWSEIELPPNIGINRTIVDAIARRMVRSYNSSAELRGIYLHEEATRIVIAAVEFSDSYRDINELPSNIQYALRFPERPRQNAFFNRGGSSWRTESVFPVFEMPGPRFPFSWEGGNDPGYVNEMFIALQHVISTELVSQMTGESLQDFSVNIQRYPHPSYLQDMAVEAMQHLFPMFIMLSFTYTAVNIVRAVTVEKELQLKETLKIMGLPSWLHWTAWFSKQFIYLIISSVLIVVLLKVNWFTNEDGFSEYAVFTNTPWHILFFYITLYLTCTIFFCFMLSGFFSKASTAALFGGVIWFLTYIPAFLLALDVNMSPIVQALTCLCINSAMAYGFQLLLARESTGGMRWGEFMNTTSLDSTRFSFGHVVIMLAIDCVLYMLIALYLEQVLPGPYGAPKPWNFFLKREFWSNSKVDEVDFTFSDDVQDITKENDPTDHAIGVKINKLTKVYGKNIAVNNISLNIYDDQITVLLGHNGAGKSTTISMLTGNLEVTRGSVTLAGYDITKQTQAARAHLGLCPQHNVIFNELTVKEHLQFFARLKGFQGAELNEDVDTLIEKLELQEKRDYQAYGLSGGQKRRLCVGIALSGAARVVLLDEPTSGMDPASRRALWDLLQKEKRGRSMILTTHFMDEADILGDRVAIMTHGRLQCVGTPFFLKRHYGAGYTLVVVKAKGFTVEICTDLINKYIPHTNIKEDRGTEVTYNLSHDYSHVFEEMLRDLESQQHIINFKNYGLTATTLEDVFMSVGADIPLNSESDDATTIDSTEDTFKYDFESSSEYLDQGNDNPTGIHLIWQHILAVWYKLWLVWSRSLPLVVLQILAPVVQINSTLGVLQYMLSMAGDLQPRLLSLTEGYGQTETILSFNGTLTSSIGRYANTAYQTMFDAPNMDLTVVDGTPIDTYYLDRTEDPVDLGALRHRIAIGASFDDDSATAWFSNFGYHDVAISLASVHSALLKAYNATASIEVVNFPLEANYQDQSNFQMLLTMLTLQLTTGIGVSLGVVSAVFIMFYIRERISLAKLLQKAAGIQPFVLWGSAAIFDWLWFLIPCLTIIISCAAFGVVGLSTGSELGRMYLCFMIYGVAMLPFNYLLSYLFSGPALGFVVMFFANVLFGMMGSQIVQALSAPQLDTEQVAWGLDIVLQFFPLYSLVTSVRLLNQVGLTEYTCLQGCNYLQAVIPNLECTMQSMCENFMEQCCVPENPYFQWEEPGVLRYLVCMLVTAVLFWILLMCIEYQVFQKLLLLRAKTPPPIPAGTLDKDVSDEAEHVRRVGRTGLSEHSLVASDLSKYYGKHLAVDQVSFSVGDTECFGLLGVNGAGKTTTFKMLMGDETISSGEAYVSGYSVKKDITKVHANIGYCPQFDAVFEELTGRETLWLFSMLRGLNQANTNQRTEVLAHALGFTKHLDKQVKQYSGGNKRKLSTAVALLGRTRLIFVDEPTTGVDPAAKRQVWRAIRGAQAQGRGFVLTSHSMEECEALCSRLTIMVNGRFQCLGTPQHLKNKFSQGFTLTIKIKLDDEPANATTNKHITQTVKDYIEANFVTPKLMEEYEGLLTYYLPDRSIPWSAMFGIMERAKKQFHVEDYSISQTTLEQIFLQFTKYQREAETL